MTEKGAEEQVLAMERLLSKGNPFVAVAWVKNILIAVVVSVPKSLNSSSDLLFNSSSTLT